MTYYTYRQNNSGGSFSTPAISVVIKADTPAQANAIAITKGIYFDDNYEIDCECCGQRWYPATDYDAVDAIPDVDAHDVSWAKCDDVPAQIVID